MANPTHAAIVDAISFDTGLLTNAQDCDLSRTCWGCGLWFDGKYKPTRAHIVAKTNGGSDQPDNFVLLCDRCHKEQPDGASKAALLIWLKHRQSFTVWCLGRIGEVMQVISEHGTPEDVEAWTKDAQPRVKDILRSGVNKAAGASVSQARDNGLWAYLDDFLLFQQRSKAAA